MTAREIFEKLLKQRGITDVAAFVNPKYEDLGDPLLMPDMETAVRRVKSAKVNSEKVAIYGDYDIDGLTATTILAEALRAFGFAVETYIPDRFVDGYGLSEKGIDELKAKGVSLLITVDTGSLSHDHIKYAAKHGIDVIVTDHHTVGETLPEAIAVINPKREDSKYPYKELAGVGVAFTLIRALQTKLDGLEQGHEKWLLDLVALGTVCDVVPLTGENRILVFWGLIVMKKTRRPGLKALAQVSGVDLGGVSTESFGFRFGPRLNASGRLDHAKLSLEALSASDMSEAMRIAGLLDQFNSDRRAQQQAIIEAALSQAQNHASDNVLVLADPDWSHGIVGIVAARLVEELAKPTFILQIEDDVTKGSARSFGDFHLADAIAANRMHIQKGGGHAMAAGVTLDTDNIDTFRTALNDYYKALKLPDQSAHLQAKADLQLDNFEGLDDELINLQGQLEPFGIEHELPIFQTNVSIASWRPVGSTQKHAKATLVDTNGVERDAIGFNLADKMPDPGTSANALFSVEHNEWNGRKTIQHKLVDIVKN